MTAFDGKNITEYLEEWNAECDDYQYTSAQRCIRFPNYCTPKIKDIIKLLPRYLAHDWEALQNDAKKLYWQHDRPRNTMAALNELIRSANHLDLNVYILKYTSITDALIKSQALSTLDRVTRLLDGLSDDLHKRVMKFCTQKSWRISPQDTGSSDPNFDEIKVFLFTEAQTSQKLTVYDKDRATRESSTSATANPGDTPAPVPSTSSASVSAPAPAPTSMDPITELTK